MFTAAMNRVQQVPFVKLNAGDTANAWSAALPAALTWLWQQLAPPDLRVQFPVHATTPGVISTIPVPPAKAHYPGLCVPVVRAGHVVPSCGKAPTRPGAEGVKSTVIGVIGGYEQRGDSPWGRARRRSGRRQPLCQNAEAGG